jgi:hypothetical protein
MLFPIIQLLEEAKQAACEALTSSSRSCLNSSPNRCRDIARDKTPGASKGLIRWYAVSRAITLEDRRLRLKKPRLILEYRLRRICHE